MATESSKLLSGAAAHDGGRATIVMIGGRLLFETKLNCLLTLTLLSLVGTRRAFAIATHCQGEGDSAAVGPIVTAGIEGGCLSARYAELTSVLGLASVLWSEDWWRVVFVFVALLVNVFAIAAIILSEVSAGPTWRSSDLAVCFHLNKGYGTLPVKALRVFNVLEERPMVEAGSDYDTEDEVSGADDDEAEADVLGRDLARRA